MVLVAVSGSGEGGVGGERTIVEGVCYESGCLGSRVTFYGVLMQCPEVFLDEVVVG